jgi:segregation and condensation protein B
LKTNEATEEPLASDEPTSDDSDEDEPTSDDSDEDEDSDEDVKDEAPMEPQRRTEFDEEFIADLDAPPIEAYPPVVEALVFASDDPLKPKEIVKAIKGIDGDDTELKPEEIDAMIDRLNERYGEAGVAFRIRKVAGGYTYGTRPEYAKYLGYLASEKTRKRLSPAALETLAIVAYKQPITKPEIEAIRGVNIDYIIGTLLEKGLVSIAGRSESVGRPLLYETTEEFLKFFGLGDVADLPKPREIDEIMNDEDFVEQKRKLMMSQIEETIEKELADAEDDED